MIEVDGYYHQCPERQTRDAERDAWLAERGYSVLRIAEKDARERTVGTVDLIVAEICARSGG